MEAGQPVGGEMKVTCWQVISFAHITRILDGISFLWKKAQWYDDYIWIRLVPFVQLLCSCTGGLRTMRYLEPPVNRYTAFSSSNL
jgi:hypothetical protein